MPSVLAAFLIRPGVSFTTLVILAALGSALAMDNLGQARNEKRGMRDAVRDAHTWVMSLLYIGTFGSFIGAMAFGAVIGVAGAAGAFGGVLVNLAFRQSFLTTGNANAAYLAFIAFYDICVLVTWTVCLRRPATV